MSKINLNFSPPSPNLKHYLYPYIWLVYSVGRYIFYWCVGLCGDETVLDIGDMTNLIPSIKREKLYNIKDLKQITGSDPLAIIGACGGPYPLVGADSEASISVTSCVFRMLSRGGNILKKTFNFPKRKGILLTIDITIL